MTRAGLGPLNTDMMLAEVVTWPEAVLGCVGFICFASFWMDRWPWQKVEVHYDCDCKCKECRPDEDEG
jgi:hypothetical protein